jgi:hypothetical protein
MPGLWGRGTTNYENGFERLQSLFSDSKEGSGRHWHLFRLLPGQVFPAFSLSVLASHLETLTDPSRPFLKEPFPSLPHPYLRSGQLHLLWRGRRDMKSFGTFYSIQY